MCGQVVWAGGIRQPQGNAVQPITQALHVALCHQAGRVVLLCKLGGHVDLRTSPVIGAGQARADPAHVGLQLFDGVVGML
ncbi:hypothetical protein D3C71_1990310 [compost metagenome]